MNQALSTKLQLQAHNQVLRQTFNGEGDISALLHTRSDFVDDLLRRQWQALGLDSQPLSLIAVGGYGRRELHPCSDIDLLFLLEAPLSPANEVSLSEFITYLWDAGLEIGHSVRTLAQTLELGAQDVTIATNLIEARLLIGSDPVFSELRQSIRAAAFWPTQKFLLAKKEEQLQRHHKANAFDLEPNIKTCPGGLRDIQTIAWVAMRYFDAANLEDLVDHGFLHQYELDELLECRAFLWQLRFAMHLISNRDENRLLFDLQPQVAQLMGYQDGTQLAVEQMMKRYYRCVRRVIELNDMLLQLFKRAVQPQQPDLEIQPIDSHFQRRGRFIEALAQDAFSEPHVILKLFLHCARNSNITAIYAPTLRSLRLARRSQPMPLMEHAACRQVFMEILRHPRGIPALSMMHKYGVLSAYLPQWRAIEGQMQFDLFHAYTVDEHTHRLLRNIERFSQPDQKDEFPLGSVLINQLPKKGLLVLAAIFHDIAKGRGGDHSSLGASDALIFCKRHELNDHDGRLVSWLVQHHLLMSVTAQRRDISDPDIVAEFAAKVRDSVHLSYLYCLTVADMCATNDTIWNNWKGALLRELYFATQRTLARGHEKPVDIRSHLRENQAKARKELIRRGFKDKEIDLLWARFKADYFLRHTLNQIIWHAEGILKHRGDEALVLINKQSSRGGTELFIYCPDKPKLFATVMAVLDNKNINVHDALVMSSKDHYALDTFVILEQDGAPLQQLARIQGIRKTLVKALAKDASAKLPSFRKLPRKMKPFKVATSVSFLKSNRHDTSMLELFALDSPGLLAKVGETFYRCQVNLLAAKITTIGERAEDVFILQTLDGKALNEAQQTQLSDALTAVLAQPTP
ncbi:bifunctional uridylyltransferase/uridylyl-removing protein GlnD [Shewanella sp. SNU WT4]|uniref:bifunctional uridylyltransferase/uridylyl-removing protein GlnD n=1 Tax=Shewanella sp. SNU WT4 TaxID=2590015 RepID=UPI001126DF38|nr:bifunctional uridylyltransferase/uridylyl-removing protein GlnD [Shewanella sp. SNU WT4]QDF67772.1 bifunctional uridylyltransferase/uridylyl-removing protein GlnD [Shewanella sp. SNU WT4]